MRGAAIAVLSGLWLFAACGSDDVPGLTGFEGPTGSGGARPGAPCDTSAAQPCSLTLGRQGNVLSCYHGTQACVDGVWQECSDGTLEEQTAPAYLANPGVRPLALTDAVDCIDNPCDPFCETFQEEPEEPLVPEETDPEYVWEEGTLADFPGGLVKKGLQQPCQTGFDCQFNMRCEAPDSGECTHGICETGEALESDCNDCAALVIAADETCGPGAPTDASGCAHDPCVTGKGLNKTCNSCVKKICDTPGLESCCTTSPNNNSNWTQACVDAVASVCGNTCGCDSGEASYGTSCYYYENSDKHWNAGKTACQARGTGWDLVTINSNGENTFVSGLKNSSNSNIAVNIGFRRSTTNSNSNPCGHSSSVPGSNRWCWSSDASLGYYNVSTPGSSTVPFHSWSSSEPDSSDICAYMPASSTQWTGLTSSNCGSNSQKRDSVCEGPPSVMQGGVSEVHAWDSDCVELAEEVCDMKCNPDDPTDMSGSCVPWYPGETDPSCAGVDLAIGVPCDGKIPVCNHGNVTAKAPIKLMHFPANSQQFPTCTIDSHPQQVTCQVTEDVPPGKCVTVDGDLCKLPNGNLSPLSGNREMMVNPDGDLIDTDEFGPVEECSCQDNWSLYSNSADTCSEPTCGGGSTAAAQVKVPVDIIIVIDNSPSMEDDIEAVQERLNEDLADILEESNLDYRVIIVSRFGDESTAISSSPASAANICIGAPLGANACTNPSNETLVLNPPFYHYSAEIESWDAWCQLLYGYNHSDEIGVTDNSSSGAGTARSWTAKAPTGWQEWLREDAFKHFLVITDDDADCSDYGYNFDDSTVDSNGNACEPPASSTEFFNGKQHNCHNTSNQTVSATNVTAGNTAAGKFDTALLALAPEQFGTSTQRNYRWHSIVNIRANTAGATLPWQPTDAIQTKMCTPNNTTIVGAGTGYQALSRLTGGLRYPICQNSTFDAIFNAIAAEVIETAQASCEFELGDTSNVDVDAATVTWTNSSDVSTSLSQVASAADCGTSKTRWYYDNPSDPTTLTLCPSTCADVQADDAAQVWLEFGCPKVPSETTTSEVYQADCASDETPQWAFLFYGTTIPSGSDAQVTFEVRTAQSEADLEDATFTAAATATVTAQDCAKNAPMDGVCPVDLYTLLGKLDSKEEFLELQVTVTPGTDYSTPSVENWEITYSCPPGE